MRHLSAGFASIIIVGLACVSVSSCSDEAVPTPDASAELAAIGEAIWDFGLERDFTRRLREGLPVERLPRIGYEAAGEAAAFQEGILLRARSIDQDALSPTESMTLQAVIWDAERATPCGRLSIGSSRCFPKRPSVCGAWPRSSSPA